MSSNFSVAVYCGSRFGHSPAFADAARTLGELIGRSGATLVYGGGRVGLMGVIADATLTDDDMAKLDARTIVEKALGIAGEICIYTNTSITIEEL